MSPIIYTPHDCEKPEGNLPAGTLYQCPECDRVWERGTDAFEDDTNLHWWVEEDPRRVRAPHGRVPGTTGSGLDHQT